MAIFAREELYIIPGIIFLIYFYKYKINYKNLFYCLLRIIPFILIVLTHMLLRKEFIPEADHLQIIGYSVKFGENYLNFGGLVKAFKSSFLPMGYISSKYSDNIQSLFSYIWLIFIFISIIFLFFKKIKIDFKKLFLLIFLVIISCLPTSNCCKVFWNIFIKFFWAIFNFKFN